MTYQSKRRIAFAAVVTAFVALAGGLLFAANVVTDGTMEGTPTTTWPLTNVTGTATASKDTAQKGSGTASLKGLSQQGKNKPYEWYHAQAISSPIEAGSTATLSLWHGRQSLGGDAGATTLSVELSSDGGATWPTILWTESASPTTAFVSAASGTVSVPASAFPTTSTYRIRLRVQTTTPNVNGSQVAVWWDDVVLDVTAPPPLTTTIGDGTDPANATPCPTDGATVADAFTLQSSYDSTVTAVNVALGTGAAPGLSLVEVTNDAGNVVYGSVANPGSDTFNVPLTANITSTTTLTQYKIRITPKGAAPNGTYTVSARVASITSDAATVTNNDAGDTSVVIDNAPPADATWGANTAGDGVVTLNWTNPVADFVEVVILRSTGSAVVAAPSEGLTYAPGNTIGASTVRYVGALNSFNDTDVVNGTTYHYRIFARDGCSNYSAGVASGALSPTAASQTTTVGDGNDPSSSSTCPGGLSKIAGAFTLQTSAGTDAVTAVTVTLTEGAAALSLVEIVDAGNVVVGSAASPSSNLITIPVLVTATATLTEYGIRITPKDDASMPAGAFSIAARITDIAATNVKSLQDADGTIVSLDNAAPSNSAWLTNTAGDAQIALAWTLPGDAVSVLLVRSQGAAVTGTPVDGTTYAENDAFGNGVVRYAGALTSLNDTSVVNGTTYHYRIFTRDACGNYASGTASGALTPSSTNPKLTAGTGSATVDSCSQITARAPFSGDVPSNSSTRFEIATAISGPWTDACASVSGGSPRTCVIPALSPATTYYIRVTFADTDGVLGQNPQIVGPWTTPAVCTQAATTAGTATAQVSACRQISVQAPLSGDGDRDGAVKVEFNTTNSWPGTTACAAISGDSPRQCLVTAIDPSTQYWIRTTYSDPDGVSGSAVQVAGPLTTAACGSDAAAPTILFLTPGRSAVIGGTERVKVQVWDAVGLAPTTPVRWSVDGGAESTVVTANANYGCGTGCSVYEFDVATAALASGPHFVTVQATDAAGNVGRVAQPIVVNNTAGGSARGAGTLLRRSYGSQLCVDCHAIATHSSQSTGSSKYGSWAIDCLTCHTSHNTTNVGLIRTQIATPNSGTMTVDLRTIDKTGGTNPQSSLLGTFDATGAPFNDGVCEVCHTKTTHYRNDTSGGDHTHYQGQRCSGCHTHVSGFKGSGCNGCHHAPPSVGKHGRHDEVWDSTSGNTASSYDDTASHGTTTQYGFACASCHAGTHSDDTAPHDGSQTNPWLVQVLFQGRNATAGASYTGTYNQSSEAGPGGQYFSWSNGTCTSSYCHSNAAPLGGQNVSVAVTWNGAATTCVSCHKTGGFGDGANDNSFLSKSHAKHIRSASGETGSYGFKCDSCHAGVVIANPADPWSLTSADLRDKRLHVDENKQDVTFAAIGSADQSGGTYDGTARTCGSTYCHSQGTSTTSFAAPNTAIAWGQTATCATCHDGNAAEAVHKMATGKHGAHIDNAATYGQNIGCASCHANTVSSDTAINVATGHALHVNGAADVGGTSVGTWTEPTCTSSRCHASGVRVGTVEYYSVNWATGGAITDCEGCHGRHSDNAFASIAGEPNYTNVPASNKFNSHRAHVKAATDCRTCHNSTIATSNRIDGSNPAKHMDFDSLPDITFAAPYAAGTYISGSRTCTVGCHGSGAPTWGGGAILCLGCHSGTEGDALANGIPNGVSTQWATKGHGSAAGGTFSSALDGCDYCHDLAAGHTPTDPVNPYRLRFSATDNTLCLKCHNLGDTGIGVNSAGTNLTLEDSSRDVEEAHFGAKHQAGEGGQLCWDCHDPHGTPTNILMVRSNVSLVATAYGVPTVTKAVTFTARAAVTDFIRTTGSPRTGICQACHDPGKGTDATVGSTKYWRWDGTDVGGGASTHYSTQICSDCHKHNKKFAGAGGNCLGCHGDGSGAPTRRAVNNDFLNGTTPNFRSHHVGNGLTMGGTVSNFDCVVCHAEGKITAGATDTSGQPHGDGKIDLRNVDSTTAYFTYDKDAVKASAGTNLAQWSSVNAVWSTQTSTALDPFCLTCHDSNGASQIAALGETGATAGNPFKDTAIANNYDQLVRPGPVDIKSKVTGNLTTNTPPAQGTFSRHAIRGQYKSTYGIYTGLGGSYRSMYEGKVGSGSLFVSTGATDANGPLWNDTSVMGCADCHTVDGANGAAGNAHGSSSEYLLKDSSGGATEGTLNGDNYVCYRCHTLTSYGAGIHTPNSADYQDYTALVGTARVPAGNTGGSRFGIACMNCHGGTPQPTAYPTSGANMNSLDGFGWIHGTNQVIRIGEGTTTRNAYRFMNGGSMRYWDPADWSGTGGSCYTLGGANGAADGWGGCTKHGRGTAYTRTITRPISY